ncbi:MAG: hypothetical protein IT558_01685 [Alphaproteobacteria bacterium]|nr:hypothetical protein [Alphaproteobacteria bacterium]
MKKANNTESGNVFLIILLGIALFAALAFTVSRSMRSESAATMSKRQAELAASDIMTYAQRLERAVSKLRSRNVSENDLDFTNAVVAGYPHGVVQPDEHKIFQKSGGGVNWQSPPSNVNDGSDWLFTGATCVPGVGSGSTGCESDGTSNEELLAVLPNLKLIACEEINRRLGISAMPAGGTVSNTKFTGSFSDSAAPVGADGKNAACIESGGNYYFYYVLLAR